MNITFSHSHLEMNEDQKNYVIKKVEKIQKYERRIADEATQIKIDIKQNKTKHTNEHITLQITLVVPHSIIRAEVNGVTVEEATDKAIEKLKKQIERYKNRKNRRNKDGKWIPQSTLETITTETETDFTINEGSKITKRKTFSHLLPMHEDEAVEQMELLSHDFFAFLNADTNQFSLLYKRAEEDSYGLIELDTSSID